MKAHLQRRLFGGPGGAAGTGRCRDLFAGLTASTIGRLPQAVWWDEYEAWQKRDLSGLGQDDVYFWPTGSTSRLGMDHDKQCVLVDHRRRRLGSINRHRRHGRVTVTREISLAWKELLLDLKRRGLETGPESNAGDGAVDGLLDGPLREVCGELQGALLGPQDRQRAHARNAPGIPAKAQPTGPSARPSGWPRLASDPTPPSTSSTTAYGATYLATAESPVHRGNTPLFYETRPRSCKPRTTVWPPDRLTFASRSLPITCSAVCRLRGILTFVQDSPSLSFGLDQVLGARSAPPAGRAAARLDRACRVDSASTRVTAIKIVDLLGA